METYFKSFRRILLLNSIFHQSFKRNSNSQLAFCLELHFAFKQDLPIYGCVHVGEHSKSHPNSAVLSIQMIRIVTIPRFWVFFGL